MTDDPDSVRSVKRTTVALPDDLFASLHAEAARLDVTPSELVREGVLLRLALAAALQAGADTNALVAAVLEHLKRGA